MIGYSFAFYKLLNIKTRCKLLSVCLFTDSIFIYVFFSNAVCLSPFYVVGGDFPGFNRLRGARRHYNEWLFSPILGAKPYMYNFILDLLLLQSAMYTKLQLL